MTEPEFSFAVAALNEEKNIEGTIQTITEAMHRARIDSFQIVAIDDGSQDRTLAILNSLRETYPRIDVIHHETNRGMGTSIREAIKAARGKKFMIVPGDNDMSVEAITQLAENAHLADLVMCYFLNREIRGRLRNLLSTVFGQIYTLAFGLYVEYINGPAVYETQRLQDLELISDRFSIPTEINVKLLRKGASFAEIPDYRETGADGSTAMTWKSLIEVIRVFLHLFATVHFKKRAAYANVPQRVCLEFRVVK